MTNAWLFTDKKGGSCIGASCKIIFDDFLRRHYPEKLGGGGHINSAGAQFDHTNMHEAVSALKETIDKMIEEGDI